MFLLKRSLKKEILDTGHYSKGEYEHCLYQLGRIGKLLGGDKASHKALKGLIFDSILDVGCGGGFYTTQLIKKFPSSKVLGIDICQDAITYAKKVHAPFEQHFLYTPKGLDDIKESFDVIVVTLVCHHLNDEEMTTFLKKAWKVCNQSLVINDLHRSMWAWLGYLALAPLFFRNRLIFFDGLLSIRKGFKRKEIKKFLKLAKLQGNCSIKWNWPFRYSIRIDKR